MARKPRDTLIDTGEVQARAAAKPPARPPKLPEASVAVRPFEEDVTAVNIISGVSPAFSNALQHCLMNPEDVAGWDAVESAADGGAGTQHVADLYRATLDRDLPTPWLLELAVRAVRFHDEWALGEEALLGLLVRVLEIDPTVKWAFDRVSLELTMRARGEELLALYDRVLPAVGPGPRQIALLEEAADVARESVGQLDRAIGYLDLLFAIDPRREVIAASLERLLTQQRRYQDLLALWARRMEVEGPALAAVLRVRAATFCLETMGDPAMALATLLPLEGASDPGNQAENVCRLLERIVEAPSASTATQREALGRLRDRYDAAERRTALVPALRATLARAEGSDVVALHGEIAARLVEDGQNVEAVADLAAVISLDPVACGDGVIDQLLAEGFDGELAGCRPTIDLHGRRELVRMAAVHAASREGGAERAIGLYGRLLRDLPGDARIIAGLDDLHRAAGQHPELIQLRRHELRLATEVPRRQALRLEVARLHLFLGEVDAAVSILRENLDEQPSDAGTVAAVVNLLEDHGQFEPLCGLIEEHALKVGSWGPDFAVELWAKAADIAERRLSDARRAIRDHERVVSMSPSPMSFDALGRMHAGLGEHDAAVGWLKRLVAGVRPGEHATDVFRLATAYVAVGRAAEALACLEACIRVVPRDLRLRLMQIELRRTSGDPQTLVSALVDAAPCADSTLEGSLLREAAKVLVQVLDAPARAVPLLERVVDLPGADVGARIELADTLHRAARPEEARHVATKVLAEFGRRHPPERAGVHFLLGCIAHEQGDGELALQELESAVAMDVGNPAAQLRLGKVSRELGHLDRAERAFHALLLLQKRRDGSVAGRPPTSETLLELYRLALQRRDADRAAENLAAAFDAATHSEKEARGLERALRDAEMPELLLRALEGHLARATDAVARAAILAETSTVLGSIGRHAEAAAAALRAVALAPADAHLHERAYAACAEGGVLAQYAEGLETMVAAALDTGDGVLGAALLLRLGTLYETELEQLDIADATYARAEDTSEELIEIWRRRARLAARRGDSPTHLAALRRLADSASELPHDERADTLYRLADLELASRETVERGLASLAIALDAASRPVEAAASLKRALDVAADREPIATLYESLARAHGDDAMLFDALSTLSTLPHPTQALLREAVEVAGRLTDESVGEQARQLLERAVAVARATADPEESLWAMRVLIRDSEKSGDLRGALVWARDAADVADPPESALLRTQAAALATALGDIDAALDSYDRLLVIDPSDAATWSAMLSLLRGSGDLPRLDTALQRAIDENRDPQERLRLRMERAQLAIEQKKHADARDTLHAVLDEQPDHGEAAELLMSLLDPAEDRDEVVALLTRRLDLAEEAGDGEAGTSAVLRLAGLSSRAPALEILRHARKWMPASPPLLRRLVDLLEPESDAAERADAVERLLEHEDGARQVGLAVQLVHARVAAEDTPGVERAIARLSAAEPDHVLVRSTLSWLATAKVTEAAHRPDDAVRLLREAADVYGRLGDHDAAIVTLEQAQALRPADMELLALRAYQLLRADRGTDAITLASDAIIRTDDRGERAELLAVRASLWEACTDHDSAVLDLQEATDIDSDRWLPQLLEALDHARLAAEADERDDALPLALRQAGVLERLGRRAEARGLLAGLPGEDRTVLRRLLELDMAAEHWQDALEDSKRLLDVVGEQGAGANELSEVALRLADVSERAGHPEEAREGLERAYDADPSNGALLERLRDLYVRAGAYRELANRLFADAQRLTDPDRRFDRLLEVGRLRVERLGESATAVGPLSDALAIQPGQQEATLLLADAFAAAGLTEDADALLRAAIARHSGRRSRALAELQQRMARVVAKEDQAAGLKWLVQALDSNPKGNEIAEELAKVAVRLGELDVAVRAFRVLTSKDLDPEVRARAYLGQAEIALLQSNESRALALARKAQAEAPDLEEAQILVRQLART